MTLKAAKKAMDAQYETEKMHVITYGRDAVARYTALEDKMDGVVDACLYDNIGKANKHVWEKAQAYMFELRDRFWDEVVASRLYER